MTLTPAYGRDYKSAKEVKADWKDGKDFVIAGIGRDSGRYINIADAKKVTDTIFIRYAKLAKIIQVQP